MNTSLYSYKNMLAVTNRTLCRGDFLVQLEKLAELDFAAIILREKDLTAAEYEKLARAALNICTRYNMPLFLHSHIQIARALGIKNIHLPLGLLVKNSGRLNDFGEVSTAIHAVSEIKIAEAAGATRLIAGHIFKTDCKKGLAPRGLDFLQAAVSAANVPVYAIGGINENNLAEVLQTGAAGGCTMSGAMRL